MTFGVPQWNPQTAAEAVKKHGSIRAAARAEGCGETALRKWYNRAVKAGIAPKLMPGQVSRDKMKKEFEERESPIIEGRVEELPELELPLPKSGVKRYLFTSVQNNTKVFEPFYENLLALADHYKARIFMARYFYIKQGLGARGDKADIVSKKQKEGQGEFWFDSRLIDKIEDRRVRIAPGLVWCGEFNTLPTAVNPLSGMETYTGRDTAIFPHSKMSMQSIVSLKHEPTKFNYTTGSITQRNYIQRKAGIKADFHHCYGALLVEVNSEGSWWVRQINADNTGRIYDLDLKVECGEVTSGHRVEAITWGDCHMIRLDEGVERAGWKADDSMTKVLRPRYQFLHDVLDFRSRNHHERKDPFKQLTRHVEREECVRSEVEYTLGKVLELSRIAHEAAGGDCQSVVVDSNHDRALERWLRESKWKTDPINMEFYLESALAKVRSIKERDATFHMIRHWANQMGANAPYITYLDEDESFLICEDSHGGIECGMHGHLGPNGSRGSINNFKKMGRKANIGHSHTAGIVEGIYQAGTSSELDLGYNVGPGSWSHSHIVTYPNGKRAIITMWRGKWRA